MRLSTFGFVFMASLIFGFVVENLALLIFTTDQIKDSDVITCMSISGIVALTLARLRVFVIASMTDGIIESYGKLKAKISMEPELDNSLYLLITRCYDRLTALKDYHRNNIKLNTLKLLFCLLLLSIGFVHYSVDIGFHINDLNLVLLWEPRSIAILASLGVWISVIDSAITLWKFIEFRKDPCIAMKNVRGFDPDAAKKEALRIFGIGVDQFATFNRGK